MPLAARDFDKGVLGYWHEIQSRSPDVQERERTFPELSQRFTGREPPHFTRSELEHIIRWKYTDGRWCKRALDGLKRVSDDCIRGLITIRRETTTGDAATGLRGRIPGVGIAGISAILAAARPDRFPVIDVFALTAICHYYDPPWLRVVPRNSDGRFQADEKSYTPYTDFCCQRATELSTSTGEAWTPRRVDMALWGLGKRLIETHSVRPDCVGQSA